MVFDTIVDALLEYDNQELDKSTVEGEGERKML